MTKRLPISQPVVKRNPPAQPIKRNPPVQPSASTSSELTTKTSKRPLITRNPPAQPRKILKSTAGSKLLQSRKAPAQPVKLKKAAGPKEAVGLKKEGGGVVPLSSKILNCLQPHQSDGVLFLHRCVTGTTPLGSSHTGAILADDMGLGKTLQSISLIYSLFLVDRRAKFVVVAPTKLLKNWAQEFDKWIGPAAQPKRVIAEPTKAGKGRAKDKMTPSDIIRQFTAIKPNTSEVLLVSYPQFRLNAELLRNCPVRLMICDEGHTLKGSENQTVEAVTACPAKSRVVVSGTPVQNDLKEFFNLCNFVNPGVFGSTKEFNAYYHGPITKANDKDSSPAERSLSAERYQELTSLSSHFMIRRMKDDDYRKTLPPLHEYAVFVKPSESQLTRYKDLANRAMDGNPLPIVMELRKLLIHPSLVDQSVASATTDFALSGKLDATISLLKHIRSCAPNDKVVIVSNFKIALDLIAGLLDKMCLKYRRIDGTTKQSENQPNVDMFNRAPASSCFAFLLSSKAGGAGLNLVGGNRLIMFDGDWNPAQDNQAMARTHRKGQKKTCFLYRMFTAGTVEEVIYQRQMQKGNLAKNALEKVNAKTGSELSRNELKDVFTLKETDCDTNDKLNGTWGEYHREVGMEASDDEALKKFSVDRKDLVTFIKSGGGRDFATDEGEGIDVDVDDLEDSDEEGEHVGFEGESDSSSDEDDDDEEEDDEEEDDEDGSSSLKASKRPAKTFEVKNGMRCFAPFQNSKDMVFPGTVSKVNKGTIDVVFDDGDTEKGIRINHPLLEFLGANAAAKPGGAQPRGRPPKGKTWKGKWVDI